VRAACVILAACVLWPSAAASAAPVHSTEHRFQVDVPPLTELVLSTDSDSDDAQILHSWSDGVTRYTIARGTFVNSRAWRRKSDFYKEVEAGLAAAAPGLTRTHRRVFRAGRVPALDLRYRNKGTGAVLLTRYLFFRRYTLVLTATSQAGTTSRQRRVIKSVVQTFKPYFKN
jgi:hypothetical protein